MFNLFSAVVSWLMRGRLLAPVLGWFKGKGRLLIEYALIAVLIAAAGLAVTLWLQREKTEKRLTTAQVSIKNLKHRVSSVEQVNTVQEGTISSLRELRAQDAKALTGLSDDYTRLSARDVAVKRQLTELEKTNAAVRQYLDEPLPPELRRLLNKAPARTGD